MSQMLMSSSFQTVSGVPKGTVVVKSGNTLKTVPSTSGNPTANRVVFVQGNSGGQIIQLPSGGGAISLKSLQGLKMISVQQQQQQPSQPPK